MSLPLGVATAQCERHAHIMMAALQEMPAHLTEAQMDPPDPALLRLLDQFVLRFTKLQDTMGNHVLRQVLALNDARVKAVQLSKWLVAIKQRALSI